jgi:hypothetical protein
MREMGVVTTTASDQTKSGTMFSVNPLEATFVGIIFVDLALGFTSWQQVISQTAGQQNFGAKINRSIGNWKASRM